MGEPVALNTDDKHGTHFTALPTAFVSGFEKGVELRIAPRSPWQSPYVERLIGSTHRECLNHVIVVNQAHLKRLLKARGAHDHRRRAHLGLDKDAPEPRPVQGPGEGKIVAMPPLGGLHHRYERRAA